MEIAIGVAGFAATVIGLWLAWFSRTDRLLSEIRDEIIGFRRDCAAARETP